MPSRLINILLLVLCLGLFGMADAQSTVQVQSPDKAITFFFKINSQGIPVYQVEYHGRTVIAESQLGFELDEDLAPDQQYRIVQTVEFVNHDAWSPVCGERDLIPNQFHGFDIELAPTAADGLRFHLMVRAYNEGIAFQYLFPAQSGLKEIKIKNEKTQFAFLDNYQAWATYTAQGKYEKVPLSAIRKGCERPLVIPINDSLTVALAEAALVDFARMKLGPTANHPNTLTAVLDSQVHTPLPLTTPWRVIMIAQSPGQLLEQNYLLLNLNRLCALTDTDWIRPGKVIREVTLTTQGGKACVDFAVQHNLQFVEFDAGWYGPENSNESDAATVTVDPARSKGPLDLPEVIRYAKERNIGIILYVNHRALERQLDDLLPLYQQWGVAGLKYGFVNVGSQQWTSWLHEAVRKAAGARMMVDIHDEYRPTGYSRTYPNLMTQEGIAGDETKPVCQQSLAILFTRMLAGAGDNTICYYDNRVTTNANHAYQLAKAVCFYSPWQFLYWYDRPESSPHKAGGAGGQANIIGNEPELEFYDRIPTVWDDTRVLQGSVGEYAIIARRDNDDWYLGAMNADQDRNWDVPLTFLPSNQPYLATIYRHDPEVPTRTHVRIEKLTVTNKTILPVNLKANDGLAIRFAPASQLTDIHSLKPSVTLPDLLTFQDGNPVTTAQEWTQKRRQEVIDTLLNYEYGFAPPAPKNLNAECELIDKEFLNGKATIKQMKLTFGPKGSPPLHLLIVTPNTGKDKYPVFLGLNFSGNHTTCDHPGIPLSANWIENSKPGVVNNRATDQSRGSAGSNWPYTQIIERGYAVATFYQSDIAPDKADATEGIQFMYNPDRLSHPNPLEWATIAAWAWGLSRAADYLITDNQIDPERIFVMGHSRNGKTALLAGALDERFALVISNQSGCGGAALNRRKMGETVKKINDRFPHWFCGAFKQFNDKEEFLPFDQHWLIALAAPRPILVCSAREDAWADPEGEFLSLKAAGDVYQLLTGTKLQESEMPPLNTLIGNRMGYHIRPGRHNIGEEDWKVFMDFADQNFPHPQ